MKGSDIEVLASRTRLEFIVIQPADGMEMTWINSVTVPKPYRWVQAGQAGVAQGIPQVSQHRDGRIQEPGTTLDLQLMGLNRLAGSAAASICQRVLEVMW
jgi:hypothetical protein